MSTKHKQREASERTCAGCRETLAPESLERFILMDEELVHDLRKRAPGRGAWVMARRECLERALAGGFARSFKSRVKAPKPEELVESMSQGIRLRLKETLQVGVRARQLAIGQEAVSEAFKQDRVCLLLLGNDASAGTRKRFAANTERKGVEVSEDLTGSLLGTWLGREFVSTLGVCDAGRANQIRYDLECLNALGAVQG